MRFLPRVLVPLLAFALLAGCGQGTAASDSDVRTMASATVTDVPGKDGPVLCTGPVAESAPPQCDGRVISNWDWSKVWGANGDKGARFGEFCLAGRDVGKAEFVLTALPRPVGTCGKEEYVASATVLEGGGTFGKSAHGPQLCVGAIEQSLPPQCSGPDISNWDWESVAGAEMAGTSIWGVYITYGTYVEGNFTLTRPPASPDDVDPPTSNDPDFATPCPEPAGGWFPSGGEQVSEDDLQKAVAFSDSLPGHADTWVDQSLGTGENDPTQLILNVRVTKDVDDAEAAMRTVWKGALCVTTAKFTQAELLRIQGAVTKGDGVLGASSGQDVVDLDVILDEGDALQKEYDAKYGKGVVRVTSALKPAPPGM